MNKNIFKITAVALCIALAGSLFSCGKRGVNNNSEIEESENDFTVPIEIPFTEYSLDGTGCRWAKSTPDKVFIINNSKELKNHIICEEFNYPTIDFSKYTLLLVSWGSGHGEVNSTFFQDGSKKYTWKVSILENSIAQVYFYWHYAILVPKLSNNAFIKFDKSIEKLKL